MNEQDKEVLKNQKENQMKLGKEIADYLTKESGFNIGSNFFRIDENAVGTPTLYFPPNTDFTELLKHITSVNPQMKDAKYESNYLLDGASKEVIVWKDENGKDKYIEVKPETSKAQEVKYDSIESVANAIRSINTTILPNQTSNSSDSRVLKISGTIGDIMVPPGLKIEGNKIVVPGNPNLTIELEMVRAEETTKDDHTFGTGTSNNSDFKRNSAQQGYNEDPLSKDMTDEKEGVTVEQFGKNLFDFRMMNYINKIYTKNSLGEVVTRETDGVYINMNVTKIPDKPIIEATLELNEIWKESFGAVIGDTEQDNDGIKKVGVTGEFFDGYMHMLEESPTKNLAEIIDKLFEQDNAVDRITEIKIMSVFASNPRVAACYGLEGIENATPDKIIKYIDHKANEKLQEHLEETTDDFVRVMEQTFNPNSNNNH